MNKPNYGLDAPKIIYIFSGIAALCFALIFITYYLLHASMPLVVWIIIGFFFLCILMVLYPVIAIIFGSLVFKFRERDWLISLINIQGNEHILDVGCGRGLLLIGVAKKLKTGKAIGIDIWSSDDQLFNNMSATLHNAQLEGVADKVEIITADARNMPFEAQSFDMVVSSWALHNISEKSCREKALLEIMRVLKPGGTVALMDIEASKEYESFFKAHNFANVVLLGPRYTFGSPTYIVKSIKK